MTTITAFAAQLKARLRDANAKPPGRRFIREGWGGTDITAGDPDEVNWDELEKEIDAFCAEFKAKQRP